MMEQIAAEMLAQIEANSFRPFHLVYRRVGHTWVRLCRSTESASYPISMSLDSIDLDAIERDIVYDWSQAFGAPADVDLFSYNNGANWFAQWNIAPNEAKTPQEVPKVN